MENGYFGARYILSECQIFSRLRRLTLSHVDEMCSLLKYLPTYLAYFIQGALLNKLQLNQMSTIIPASTSVFKDMFLKL